MKTILLPFICCLIHVCLNAQAGTPDYSFGDSGRVATRFYTDVVANCVTTQQDGKILAAGGSMYAHDWDIARYLDDGRLDSSFNHDGKMIGFIPGSKRKGASYVTGIIVQPDNKILAVGVACINITHYDFDYDFAVARYMPDGSRDLTFGNGGYVTTDLGTVDDKSLAITLQIDGKIVIVGTYSGDTASGNAVVRYTANGRLNSAFGENGILKYALIHTFYSLPVAIQPLPNNKLLIAGTDYYAGGFTLLKLKSNGNRDSSFGLNGAVNSDAYGLLILCHGMALQKDGKIVLAGSTSPFSFGIATVVGRYTQDGSLDSSFGNKGFIIDSEINVTKEFYGVCVQPDNKIVAAGYYFKSLKTSGDFYVARYTANGKKDPTFGNKGIGTIVDFNKMGDGANAMALLPNNKIVAAGGAYLSYSNSSFGIVVYNNDEDKNKTASIENVIRSKESIRIFPNPAKDILTITGLNSKMNYDLLIVNEKGNPITKASINNNNSYQLNVQNLSSGVYYMNVVANNKVITTLKFIKE